MPMDMRDVVASVSRFMGNRAVELGYGSPQILPGFSGLPKDRPIWVLQSIPGALPVDRLRHQTMMQYRFNMNILTAGGNQGYHEALKWVSECQRKLMQNNWRIPGILVDFKYPRPQIRYLEGEGSLPAGTYYVGVSGHGNTVDIFEETLLSEVQEIEVEQNNGRIEVLIPRYPAGYSWWNSYSVYMSTSPTNLKRCTPGATINVASVGNTVYNIDDVASVGNPSPLNPPRITKFRLIEVMHDTFNTSVIADVSREAGGWVGSISCVVKAPLTTINESPLGYTLEQVGFETDVD